LPKHAGAYQGERRQRELSRQKKQEEKKKRQQYRGDRTTSDTEMVG